MIEQDKFVEEEVSLEKRDEECAECAEVKRIDVNEIFKRHDVMGYPIYWYDPYTKIIYEGSNILPHEPDYIYVSHLIYIGNQESYDTFKSWGITEFYTNGGGNVACVGKNVKTKTWYGWSHRGHGKFYVGFKVVRGSMLSEYIAAGYRPKTDLHCKVLAHLFAELLD
jgi:hypothetical protein